MRRLLIVFGSALALAAAAFGITAWLVYGDRTLPSRATDFEIPPATSIEDIAFLLEREGVVRSGWLVRSYLRVRRPAVSIQAAEYTVAARSSVREVVDTLAAGGRPPQDKVTIPEGFTAEEIAQRLAGERLATVSDFMNYVRFTSLVLGGVRTDGLEGYLFPDTYLVPRHTQPAVIAAMMTSQFEKNLPKGYATRARQLGYSVRQIITVASIIEREAKADDERPIIAGVYYNRLRRHMPLEVDATIEYALPKHKQSLSLKDLAVDSPYNTYAHTGLPPTPISNPGRKSIDAAFHPAQTEYLYYVYKGNGHHQFSKTLAEQEAAERRYLH